MEGKPKYLYIVLAGLGLVLVYVLQHYLDFYSLLQFKSPEYLEYHTDYANHNFWQFTVNKVGRYLLNDGLSILLIYGIFGRMDYVKFSVYVLLFGLFILLPIYIGIYFAQIEGMSSMVSHLHRVVMNPVLMMLLIPAFYLQSRTERNI